VYAGFQQAESFSGFAIAVAEIVKPIKMIVVRIAALHAPHCRGATQSTIGRNAMNAGDSATAA
jgi:hypothetical protein